MTKKIGNTILDAIGGTPMVRINRITKTVEDELELQTDPIQWVNQESQTIKDIREIEHQVGSSSEFGVVFRADDVSALCPTVPV